MKKAIICITLAAAMLASFGCKKPSNTDNPGYVPPDLTYPGNEKIEDETEAPETDVVVEKDTLPFDPNPETEPVVTRPVETSEVATAPRETEPSQVNTDKVQESEPLYTTAPSEDKPEEPKETTPLENQGTETPVQTEEPYTPPLVILVPTEIPYVILSEEDFLSFIDIPDPDYFLRGVNIYYTVQGEEGVIYMNKVDNYGFEKFIGVYQNSELDLTEGLIEFVLNGNLQDILVERKLNPTIDYIGGVGHHAMTGTTRFVWFRTAEDDYIVIVDEDTREIQLYTLDEYSDILEGKVNG